MRGLPQEFVYFLIFLGVLVVQFLMKRRAASRQPQEPDEDEAVSAAELAAEAAWLEQQALQAAQAAWSPPAQAVPLAPPHRAPEPPVRRTRPRRFSRQALMGNRRDVQNAIVIAAILGPCRALEPPGGDAAPVAPPPPAAR